MPYLQRIEDNKSKEDQPKRIGHHMTRTKSYVNQGAQYKNKLIKDYQINSKDQNYVDTYQSKYVLPAISKLSLWPSAFWQNPAKITVVQKFENNKPGLHLLRQPIETPHDVHK